MNMEVINVGHIRCLVRVEVSEPNTPGVPLSWPWDFQPTPYLL